MADSSSQSKLETVLQAPPPDAIAQLDSDKQAALAALLEDAGARQQQAMETALEDALSYVPALLRGSVRRVLFP